jgi:proton-dependent oligopeptide transporter, POT family
MCAAATLDRRTFLGQPVGVAYLAMTEAWERFSFYGMRALLVLYMVQEILLPGRIEGVAGMDGYRAWAEGAFGPMSTQAFASQTFGLYAGFVYFTPMFGGLIADRWLGAKKTVMIGIVLMTLGHFAMVFDASFLLALVLLVLGSGCLKGNIAAQVGHLYAAHEEAGRTRGYTIFSTGINIGATLGPLACGLAAQVYGWHAAFGLAGAMMLLAASFYFAGWTHLADDRPAGRRKVHPPMERRDWTTVMLIAFVLALSLGQFLAHDQIFNVGMIWLSEQASLATSYGKVPEAWFAAEDSFASIAIVPFLIWLWHWQGRHGEEPHDTEKMAMGALVMTASMLALATGAWQAEAGGQASIVWPILAFFLSGAAFMFSWPVMLAFVSRRAPPAVNAVLMASVYLTGFITGVGSGWLGRFYAPLGATQFWLLHAGIALAGAGLLWALGPVLRRRMDALGTSAEPAPLQLKEA